MALILGAMATVVAALGLMVCGIESAPDAARAPLGSLLVIVALAGAVVFAIWLVRQKPLVPGRPRWQSAFIWRWPVTTSLAIGASTGSFIAAVFWDVLSGKPEFAYVLVALFFFVGPFLHSLIRLLSPAHPDRNYGRAI